MVLLQGDTDLLRLFELLLFAPASDLLLAVDAELLFPKLLLLLAGADDEALEAVADDEAEEEDDDDDDAFVDVVNEMPPRNLFK